MLGNVILSQNDGSGLKGIYVYTFLQNLFLRTESVLLCCSNEYNQQSEPVDGVLR